MTLILYRVSCHCILQLPTYTLSNQYFKGNRGICATGLCSVGVGLAWFCFLSTRSVVFSVFPSKKEVTAMSCHWETRLLLFWKVEFRKLEVSNNSLCTMMGNLDLDYYSHTRKKGKWHDVTPSVNHCNGLQSKLHGACSVFRPNEGIMTTCHGFHRAITAVTEWVLRMVMWEMALHSLFFSE